MNLTYRTTSAQYRSYRNEISAPDPIPPAPDPNVPDGWVMTGSTAGEGMVLFWFWVGVLVPQQNDILGP